MQFTSLQFLVFFPSVVAGYLVLQRSWRAQNTWLLAASYYFYIAFSWKFSLLLLFSTAANYVCGAAIHRATSVGVRRAWLWTSLAINLGILGFFKYYNFFAANLEALLGLVGLSMSWHIKNLILPLGISFYTFQALSYPIDIYRRRLEPVRSFPQFALFIAFFPQLVSGPIERATNLLPQIAAPRSVTVQKFAGGVWLVVLGIYKKVVVSEGLGRYAHGIFDPADTYAGLDVLLACGLFSIKIYADFAGYTDVARGCARMLGFELIQNFRAPYFAPNIQDFWSRWHLSLTNWIKDYMFYPMALSRRWAKLLGPGGISMVIMIVIGFWHGASWNFLLWGAYHGALIHAYTLLRPHLYRRTQFQAAWARRLWFCVRVAFTFWLVAIAEVLFYGRDFEHAWHLFRDIFANPVASDATAGIALQALVLLAIPVLLDLDDYHNQPAGPPLSTWRPFWRFVVRVGIVVATADVLLSTTPVLVNPYVYAQF